MIRENELDDEVDDDLIESDWSDAEEYDLQFNLNQEELNGLREAFDLLQGEDKRISFFDLFRHLKRLGIETKQPLLFGILKRVEHFEEAAGRINFDTLVKLLLRAMNLRNTKQQATLLFNVFDNDKSGAIHAYNIKNVSRSLGKELSLDQIHSIIEKCSSDKKKITLSNFRTIMSYKRTGEIRSNNAGKVPGGKSFRSVIGQRNSSIGSTGEPTARTNNLYT